MLSFSALNVTPDDSEGRPSSPLSSSPPSDEESNSSSDSEDDLDPVSLESHAHSIYTSALTLYAEGNLKSAGGLFKRLLDSRFLTKKAFKDNEVAKKLRFNTLKYLGLSLGAKEGEKALQYLIEAYKLDDEDVNLCFKIGVFAAKLKTPNRLVLARSALERTLELSANHWPALDLIVTLTFQLGDFQGCLKYIDKALKKKGTTYKRGLQVRQTILNEYPAFEGLCPNWPTGQERIPLPKIQFQDSETMKNELEPDPLVTKVGDITWKDFLNLLISESEREISGDDALRNYVLEYEQTKPDPVEVSVQNVVEEMIDLVSEGFTVVDQIVEDIVTESLNRSTLCGIHCIIEDIITEVVKVGIPPPVKQKSKFTQEVPADLLEIRRSTRVRGADNNEDIGIIDEITALSLLESYIPENFKTKRGDNNSDDEKKKKEKEKEDAVKALHPFPSENEQMEQVKEFVKNCNEEVCFSEFIFDALKYLLKYDECVWSSDLKRAYLEAYLVWRKALKLPNEFGPNPEFHYYLDVMLLANEILIYFMKKDDYYVEDEAFVKDDFLHLRLIFTKLDRESAIRVTAMHHSFFMEKDKTPKAVSYGELLAEYLPDNIDLILKFWPVTGTSWNKQELLNSLSYLEHSKILHKVQTFFDDNQFQSVIAVLSRTIDDSNERDATWFTRLLMLIESLWNVEQYGKCLERCALALESLAKDYQANLDDTINILKTIDCCFEMLEEDDDPYFIPPKIGSKLCTNLIQVMLGQIDQTVHIKSNLQWMIFYKVLVSEEKRTGDKSDIPASANFLVSAHEYIGKLSLCAVEHGSLLQATVKRLAKILEIETLQQDVADLVRKNLDQCLFCLYSHPSKKARSSLRNQLTDHNVPPVALTWDKCIDLYKVIVPKKTPEFDDFKSLSISSDTEALLRRFVALVPDEFEIDSRPKKVHHYLVNMDKDDAKPPSFPSNQKFPKSMLNMFYLLADFYFKNSQLGVAIPYYLKDLSLNPNRNDAFVALALSKTNRMEEKLSNANVPEFRGLLKEARTIHNCFKSAMEKNWSNATIRIEAGNFAYFTHAYCSRLLKQDSQDLSIEDFKDIENNKKGYLVFAFKCYTKALEMLNNTLEADSLDERWLLYYMRGKIKEKKTEKKIGECLDEYIKSMQNLIGQGIHVPRKLGFGPTPELTLELLEIFYRFHASILKLELESDFQDNNRQKISEIAERLIKVQQLDVFKKSSNQSGPDSSNSGLEPPEKRAKPDMTWEAISQDCIQALERVKNTFPHHYKSLQLLSHYFLTSSRRANVARAKEYLISHLPPSKQPTLFGDRKPHNFFYGIWRSQVSEFERPGSFHAHVAKCTAALFTMCKKMKDHNMFLEAGIALKKIPEGDRKYLFESDRVAFHQEAMVNLFQILNEKTEKHIRDQDKMNEKLKYALDIYNCYNKLKRVSPKSEQVKVMMTKLYQSFLPSGAPNPTQDHINVFYNKLSAMEKTGTIRDMEKVKDLFKYTSSGHSMVSTSSTSSTTQKSQAQKPQAPKAQPQKSQPQKPQPQPSTSSSAGGLAANDASLLLQSYSQALAMTQVPGSGKDKLKQITGLNAEIQKLNTTIKNSFPAQGSPQADATVAKQLRQFSDALAVTSQTLVKSHLAKSEKQKALAKQGGQNQGKPNIGASNTKAPNQSGSKGSPMNVASTSKMNQKTFNPMNKKTPNQSPSSASSMKTTPKQTPSILSSKLNKPTPLSGVLSKTIQRPSPNQGKAVGKQTMNMASKSTLQTIANMKLAAQKQGIINKGKMANQQLAKTLQKTGTSMIMGSNVNKQIPPSSFMKTGVNQQRMNKTVGKPKPGTSGIKRSASNSSLQGAAGPPKKLSMIRPGDKNSPVGNKPLSAQEIMKQYNVSVNKTTNKTQEKKPNVSDDDVICID